MKTKMTHRLLLLIVTIAALLSPKPARAQSPAANPSPSPSPAAKPAPTANPAPSPAPVAEPRPEAKVKAADEPDDKELADLDELGSLDDLDIDVDVDVDAERIEAEVAASMDRARAEVERSLASVNADLAKQQTAMEKEARAMAKAMAKADARAGATAANSRAIAEAIAASEPGRSEAIREAMQDAQEKAREQAEEARERAREKAQDAREKAREKELEARERARERAQEDRERARERAQEATERFDELYDEAMESIDEEDWGIALRPLEKLMSLNARVDAALYWKSYSQWKMNQTAACLATLARLQKEFPSSRWAKEGKALEMEVRGKSGQAPRLAQVDDEPDVDLKLMAVSALAQSDPEEAMPMLTKILASPTSSRKVRERALFVLAQIGNEQAATAIAQVARGNTSPELQRKAIQYLGVFGGASNRKVLSDIYGSTADNALRKQILNSFMVSGDKARVLQAAKTEKNPDLRADAIRLLGVMGGSGELSQMYATATTAVEKKAILQALFIGGAIEPVANAARTEKDREVRLTAVRNLGLMGRRSEMVLIELYRAEQDPEIKKETLNAFFLQGNATRLVEIARSEKDPGLKKEAVHWLSLTNSKEARAYMIELLKE